MSSFAGPTLPAWMRTHVEAGLGSICLFGSNVSSPTQLEVLTNALHDIDRDLLVATDEEGGDVTRLHMREGSPHPGNAALGAADDETMTSTVASDIGRELAAVGVDLDLAPVIDVNSNPSNPVIGVRSFGADPLLVARHTAAYVTGLQGAGVAACVKHFPGHGDTAVDSHLGLPTVDASLDVLRQRELVPFVAAVSAGTVAVMTSHVVLPALDGALPATLSPAVVSVLRGELGFAGLLVSDALDMKGASAGRGEPAAAVLALAAGCDLLCLGADKEVELLDAVLDAIVEAVRAGELSHARLEQAAERVVSASRQVQEWRSTGAARRPAEQHADMSHLVAARAQQVIGTFAPIKAAVVLRFQTRSNIAVGQVPWGLPEDGRVLDGGRQVDVGPDSSADHLVSVAADAPLVALVREAHRHPWVVELLGALADRRPDLVVVEMGWPDAQPLPGTATVLTLGASAANGAALDELLAHGSRR